MQKRKKKISLKTEYYTLVAVIYNFLQWYLRVPAVYEGLIIKALIHLSYIIHIEEYHCSTYINICIHMHYIFGNFKSLTAYCLIKLFK